MPPDDSVLPSHGRLHSSVVLLHGYASHGAANRADGQAFVNANTELVLPDAPGHGARADGRVEEIAELPDSQRRDAILAIAREWCAELPEIAARCRQRGSTRVALVGISMGGFAALGALAPPCPFAAVAAVLAAPTLLEGIPHGPPVLLGLAGRDAAVPAAPGREFAREYGAQLLEYPESEHMMHADDWHDLWARTTAFVRRHLDS